MNDIRLLLTDLDGTLLRSDHLTVSPRTREAFAAAKTRGIRLCACTGRLLCMLPPAVAEMGFDYAITSNGASCNDLRTGERLFSAYIPARNAEAAWELLKQSDCMVEWFVGGDLLMDRHNYGQWERRLRPRWHREYLSTGGGIVVEDIRSFFAQGAPELEKISVFDCPPGMRESVIEPMLALGCFEISTSLGHNFEITDLAADKGQALHSLCAHLGITPAQTVAFGDGGNDDELLEAAGTGVEMANGLDSLKAIADAVTLSNDEDGVADYIERFLL